MHQGRIIPDGQAREVPPPADVCARVDLPPAAAAATPPAAAAAVAPHGCFNSGVARMMTDRKEK